MATIKAFRVTSGSKINCGHYETVEPVVELTVELADGEDAAMVADALRPTLNQMWDRAALSMLHEKIVQRQESDGPPLSAYAYNLYKMLASKYGAQ